MTGLGALLLPIVVSAVFVFIVSSIIHMGPFWHRNDYPPVPNQEAARAAIGALNIPPGDYMMPRTFDMKEMKTPEFQAKLTQGPQLIMTVLPNGPWTMGRSLGLWFIYCLLISLLAGYVAGAALPPGSEYIPVFRFAGVTAFIGYAAALWQMSIWYRRQWSMTAKSTIDGLIYGLVTAGVFGWLWPQ